MAYEIARNLFAKHVTVVIRIIKCDMVAKELS